MYYIRKFYLGSQYQPHYALMPCRSVIVSFVSVAFITAISEVLVGFIIQHISDFYQQGA